MIITYLFKDGGRNTPCESTLWQVKKVNILRNFEHKKQKHKD